MPPLSFQGTGSSLVGFCMCLLKRENTTKTSAESPAFEVSTGNCSAEQSRVSVLLVDGLFVWFSVTAAASAAGTMAWHHRKLKCLHSSLHFSTQNKGLYMIFFFLFCNSEKRNTEAHMERNVPLSLVHTDVQIFVCVSSIQVCFEQTAPPMHAACKGQPHMLFLILVFTLWLECEVSLTGL